MNGGKNHAGGCEHTVFQELLVVEVRREALLFRRGVFIAMLTDSCRRASILELEQSTAAVVTKDQSAESTVMFSSEACEGNLTSEADSGTRIRNPIVSWYLYHYIPITQKILIGASILLNDLGLELVYTAQHITRKRASASLF